MNEEQNKKFDKSKNNSNVDNKDINKNNSHYSMSGFSKEFQNKFFENSDFFMNINKKIYTKKDGTLRDFSPEVAIKSVLTLGGVVSVVIGIPYAFVFTLGEMAIMNLKGEKNK